VFEAIDEFQAMTDSWHVRTSYDDMIRDMRRELRDMERDISGEIIAAFYIGRGDRLYRLEFEMDMEYSWERIRFDMVLDFGTSANDIWTLELGTRMSGMRTSIMLEWEVNETSRGGETIFRGTNDMGWMQTSAEVIVEWTDRGNFNLIVGEDYYTEELLSGRYTINDNGFNLIIDDPFAGSYWGQSLNLEISAGERSGSIGDITFINISDWSASLFDSLADLLSFGGFADPIIPVPPIGSFIDRSQLLGTWEFYDGVGTYFFWSSEFVEFKDSGEVYSSASGDGFWIYESGILTVVDDSGGTYNFSVERNGDILSITDHDNDTGRFRLGGNIVQPPPPPPPPPPAGSTIYTEDLIGEWEFLDGRGTYFFWRSSFVEFYAWGDVHSADEIDVVATWAIENGMLVVRYDRNEYRYEISLDGDILSITDHDGDTGRFQRR